jgi:toxin YoeB
MEVVLLKRAKADRDYWKSTGNTRILKRITALLKDIEQHPFSGIGKPEPLKGENGKWSRRITDEHRLVYSISNGRIYIFVFSMRYHYSK